jgi:DNA replication protein DnaC
LNKKNIVFLGTSGVEKTHLATSIGIAAAKKRTSTYFMKCNDLIMNLKKAKLENRLENRLKHYAKYKLLIIDEIGYLPIDAEDAKLFFQLIDMRYEQKSTILTINASFSSHFIPYERKNFVVSANANTLILSFSLSIIIFFIKVIL